jgi:RHS repeat-associated protein
VYQHFEYFPFGETFFEDRHDHQRTPYLFNGKELDKETGLYFYGARYYDPRISMFYGVDPLAEKYINQSPYAYAANNPIRFVDWMGMGPGDPPSGTTQIYLKFKGSFGPQISFSIGYF